MEQDRRSHAGEAAEQIRARAARYRDYAAILAGHDDAQRDVLGLADELDALADRTEGRSHATMRNPPRE